MPAATRRTLAPPHATGEQQQTHRAPAGASSAQAADAPAPGADAAVRDGAWTPRVIAGLVTQPTAAQPWAQSAPPPHRFAVGARVLLQVLATAGRSIRARELAQAVGREPSVSQLESIRQTMRRCAEQGQALLVDTCVMQTYLLSAEVLRFLEDSTKADTSESPETERSDGSPTQPE
jgi:hypothetical protein